MSILDRVIKLLEGSSERTAALARKLRVAGLDYNPQTRQIRNPSGKVIGEILEDGTLHLNVPISQVPRSLRPTPSGNGVDIEIVYTRDFFKILTVFLKRLK